MDNSTKKMVCKFLNLHMYEPKIGIIFKPLHHVMVRKPCGNYTTFDNLDIETWDFIHAICDSMRSIEYSYNRWAKIHNDHKSIVDDCLKINETLREISNCFISGDNDSMDKAMTLSLDYISEYNENFKYEN